jgi:hypothetical protein
MDWGGWNTFYYAHFDGYDIPNGRKNPLKRLYYNDTRLWTKMTYRADRKDPNSPEQSLYIRLKQRMSWESPGTPDYDNPSLDMGYVTLQHSIFTARIGRQFLRVGRGIVYQDVHDGFDLRANFGKWRAKAFISKTRPNEPNIDTSQPGYGEEHKRYFVGGQIDYTGLLYHRPYAYFVAQKDKSREKPDTVGQEFDYDSQYFGLGSEGQMVVRNLRYWSELMLETGHSNISGTDVTKPIRAWGTDLGLAYYLDHPIKPQLTFEYLFGSGDPERTSVTNTTGGNLTGNDTNFLYFGSYPVGYATNFRVSNIHIFKLGVSGKPLNLCEKLKKKDVTAGVNLYFYQKAKVGGVISDTDSTSRNANMGEEVDFFVDWRITSDLIWSTKFGAFNTGAAFNDNTSGRDSNLKFLSTNLTLTF